MLRQSVSSEWKKEALCRPGARARILWLGLLLTLADGSFHTLTSTRTHRSFFLASTRYTDLVSRFRHAKMHKNDTVRLIRCVGPLVSRLLVRQVGAKWQLNEQASPFYASQASSLMSSGCQSSLRACSM